MAFSHLGDSDFERDDLVFVSDLTGDEILDWSDYDAEVAYLRPLMKEIAEGELGCPSCPDGFTAPEDHYQPIEPVFTEFENPAEFTLHAMLFECPKQHQFIITLDEPLYEKNPPSAIHGSKSY